MSRYIIILVTFLCCSCSASRQSTHRGLLTVVTVGKHILVGSAYSYGNFGKFQIQSLDTKGLRCNGKFRYTQQARGKARFKCTNGEKGSIRIDADGNLTGTGVGTSSMGPVKAAFGYSIKKMNRLFQFPNGKKLVNEDGKILVVDENKM